MARFDNARERRRARAGWIAVVAAFVLSRIVFYGVAGIRFDAGYLSWFWQYIETDLLREDLLRSLFYFHAQPPLFNAFLGTVLKLTAGEGEALFATIYRTAGLLLHLSLYGLLLRLAVPRAAAVGVVAAFAFSPTSILYENWLFYSYPMALVLTAAALALHRGLDRRRDADLAAFFGLLAVAALTRSTFHLVWLLACTALVLRLARPGRRALAAALISVALVAGLYAKNQIVFGSFSASSWLGLSLARMTVATLDPDRRNALAAEGEVSEIAAIPPFSALGRYPAAWIEAEGPDVPVLRRRAKANRHPNFNYATVPRISETYMRDALAVIRRYPGHYASSLAQSWLVFGLPPSEIWFLDRSRAKIDAWDRAVNTLAGQPARFVDFDVLPVREESAYLVTRVGYAWAVVALAAVLASLIRGVRGLRSTDDRERSRSAVLLFAAGIVAWVAVVSNAVEMGENNRFRVMVEPLLWALAAATVTDGLRRLRARRRGGRGR